MASPEVTYRSSAKRFDPVREVPVRKHPPKENKTIMYDNCFTTSFLKCVSIYQKINRKVDRRKVRIIYFILNITDPSVFNLGSIMLSSRLLGSKSITANVLL